MANISVRRKSGFIQRSGGMRRESLWIGGSHVITSLAAASTAVIQTTLGAGLLALRPFTIVRTRGVFLAFSDQLVATENWGVGYGIAVVSEQASAIGVTAVPTPMTDSGSDLWFVYEFIAGRFDFITVAGIEANTGRERIVDSKAMRKVEDGQQVVDVVETSSSSSGVNVATFSRTLIKLH